MRWSYQKSISEVIGEMIQLLLLGPILPDINPLTICHYYSEFRQTDRTLVLRSYMDYFVVR